MMSGEHTMARGLPIRPAPRYPGGSIPVDEASSEETPYGRYITSDGWFVHNLANALAVRNDVAASANPDPSLARGFEPTT